MSILESLVPLIGKILPFEWLQMEFMQQALVALLLLVPMTGMMGVQVINFRMAFFSDAISHSTFAGVALGLILSISPHWSMPIFGLMVGFSIIACQRLSYLDNDTLIGVFFSGIMAIGLALVSREKALARDLQRFLYGDVLTITKEEILLLMVLTAILFVFQFFAYNRMLYIGLNPMLANVHRVRVKFYQYAYAGLLSLVVVSAVNAVGVLLVTAMLMIPAATARNLAKTAGSMFWWSLLLSLLSAVSGLYISTQEWARTATGATVVLVAFIFFMVSGVVAHFTRKF